MAHFLVALILTIGFGAAAGIARAEWEWRIAVRRQPRTPWQPRSLPEPCRLRLLPAKNAFEGAGIVAHPYDWDGHEGEGA